MAAITITTNLSEVIGKIASNFELLKDKDYLLRPLAIETIPNMKERIHKEGQATDGEQIGTYANSYMRIREKNKRGEDRKIIVSLTRQLENDWAVLGTSTGYGIGFNNPFNKQKAKWVEENKSKIIFNLSEKEKEYISERIKELVNGAINS